MQNIIQLLPDALANQIAAGEVIQRPASVVKELLDNSLDAHSTQVQVVIKDIGKTLIQVIDNGVGMSEIDARMSLEKHATSKIQKADDLFNIQTMGFRGEALPSMVAVAQVEIITRTAETELGTRLVVEGSKVKLQEPVAASVGTTISVKNLFFNVPARRNFLKSGAIETRHIIEEFQYAALSRPDIAFNLYQNEQETYCLPAAKLANRIIHLFGETYRKHLIPCEAAADVLRISGYIGNPAYAKKTRGEQFFFVNNRFIKSAYLNHAIKHAFEDLIPKQTSPFYVLFIEIDPKRIDINVHPTKTEIKFDDEKMVYAMLLSAVKKALSQHGGMTFDFDTNSNVDPLGLQVPSKLPSYTTMPRDRSYTAFKQLEGPKVSTQDWEKLYARITPESELSTQQPVLPLSEFTALASPQSPHLMTPDTALEEDTQQLPAVATSPLSQTGSEGAVIKMQLHGRYILTSIKSGLLLIDQHAAHERILYEKYLKQLQNHAGNSQQLLFPEQIHLSVADLELIEAYQPVLKTIGFAIEVFGNNSIVIAGYPVEATQQNPQQLVEHMLEQIKWNQSNLSIPREENAVRSLAKHAAIQPGKKLEKMELDSLVDQLFACNNPNHTPSGKNIWTIISLEELAKRFKD